MSKFSENEWGTFLVENDERVHIPSEKLQKAIDADTILKMRPDFEKIIWMTNNPEEAHFYESTRFDD